MNSINLGLAWIGKENWPKLEPWILIEDPTKSHNAPCQSGQSDVLHNRLIFGDNFLVLEALEQQFTGKIISISVDPSYKTRYASSYYVTG